jgi:phosphatidylserine/phosphatidylglycerophosphate/cardiolipin synthase-like enzyme
MLREKTSCEVMFSAQLHAKLYILECDGFRYAMLGSANLTRRADNKNRELAVEFRTTCTNRSDPVAAMIDELLVFAYELMSDEAAQLQP